MGGGIAGKKFPGTLQPNALHVYVKDADEVCKKAVAAGATRSTPRAIRITASAPAR